MIIPSLWESKVFRRYNVRLEEIAQLSIILELRDHYSHAGTPLVHKTSEDVVLSNVFGIVRNLEHSSVLTPWIRQITGLNCSGTEWSVEFWEKQPRPIGPIEGSTTVDLVLESQDALLFVEVKMDAPASSRTTHEPNRNQLLRNLDVGFCRAREVNKSFALIFITPELYAPAIVQSVKESVSPFPANKQTTPKLISNCLYWTPWSSVADAAAAAFINGTLGKSESRFALDLLSYLAKKGLWENSLPDNQSFYLSKLHRSLRRDESPFTPYSRRRADRYQGWRDKEWDESSLRSFLQGLRLQDKALLKVLANAGGVIRQAELMRSLPMLHGKTSASLRSLKSHVNAGCKALDRAQILSEGIGSGEGRIHELNPRLGHLRELVIQLAKDFSIDWNLLQTKE